ncbi:unnamed protein product [Cylicocyclus nassatus]|uniref:Uncharacterized protein n=1 Tax=Cylicocyclus nassatus TaxID=53992 RepID=A0AA36MFC1_CYLNA|nr:unnamed protein product [Cylicocyclus nassatus]
MHICLSDLLHIVVVLAAMDASVYGSYGSRFLGASYGSSGGRSSVASSNDGLGGLKNQLSSTDQKNTEAAKQASNQAKSTSSSSNVGNINKYTSPSDACKTRAHSSLSFGAAYAEIPPAASDRFSQNTSFFPTCSCVGSAPPKSGLDVHYRYCMVCVFPLGLSSLCGGSSSFSLVTARIRNICQIAVILDL